MGESARLVDTFKIKGAHLAMYSGLLAANSIVNALESNREAPAEQLNSYEKDLYQSFIYKEMYRGKFVRYLYKLYYVLAACYTGTIDRCYGVLYNWLYRWKKTPHQLRGRYTRDDSECSLPIEQCKKDRHYDQLVQNNVVFDKTTSLVLSNLNYDESMPSHIQLKDPSTMKELAERYGQMESQFCPAQVYEYVTNENGQLELLIHHTNCLQCKTCAIKAPQHHIDWKPPKHGSGPNYIDM